MSDQQEPNEPTGVESMPGDPSENNDGEASGMPGSEGPMSDEEAVSILDEQLDESIAVFDGMIINERATVQAIESEFPEDDMPLGDDEPLFEEADISENSDGQKEASSSAAGDSNNTLGDGAGDGTIISSSGVRTNSANAQVPADVSNGSDDDIVARQIREAAMKEKDPELREKLWEEYRKYKRGQ